MDIASRLSKAMKDARITSQNMLARLSGVPQPTINRILKGGGKKGPETDTLMKLAAACGVRFEWLREGVGPQYRTEAPGMSVGEMTAQYNSGTNNAAHAEVRDDNLMLAVRLLMLFHGTDADGRARIMKVAEKTPQVRGVELVRNHA